MTAQQDLIIKELKSFGLNYVEDSISDLRNCMDFCFSTSSGFSDLFLIHFRLRNKIINIRHSLGGNLITALDYTIKLHHKTTTTVRPNKFYPSGFFKNPDADKVDFGFSSEVSLKTFLDFTDEFEDMGCFDFFMKAKC